MRGTGNQRLLIGASTGNIDIRHLNIINRHCNIGHMSATVQLHMSPIPVK